MPIFSEMEYSVNTGAGWEVMETGGSSDLLGTVEISRGLGLGFRRRVAGRGAMTLALRNTAQKYSPDHGAALAGFEVGAEARLRVQYDSAWYTVFRGLIEEIRPAAGAKGPRQTLVKHSDRMDELFNSEVGAEALHLNKRADEEISSLVNKVFTPPATAYATGQSVFDRVGFRSGQSIAGAIADMVDSEGYPALFYIQADGTVTFEDRHARRIDTAAVWSLDNTMSGLTLTRRRTDYYSEIGVMIHPADIGLGNEVLGSVSTVMTVEPGETRTIRVRYRDPDDLTIKEILGKDVLTVVVNTDIVIEDAPAAGVDISGDFTIQHSKGANASDITLVNNGDVVGYVTTLQVRGLAIRLYEDVEFTTSTGAAANQKLALDHLFNDDQAFARNQADWLSSFVGEPFSSVSDCVVRPGSDVLMQMILGADVSDGVLISEAQTGLAAARFFINSKRLILRAGGMAEAHFTLERADPLLGWVLGTSGRSELNQTTYLG